jgi:hypothetical protein
MGESDGQDGSRPPRAKKHALRQPKDTAANKRLGLQTRKLLGKHYANKYRSGRG